MVTNNLNTKQMDNRELKASELRIGNLIQWEDESEEITEVKSIIYYSDDEYEVKINGGHALLSEFVSIPITEDWLLKFGFAPRIDKEKRKSATLFLTDDIHWNNGAIMICGIYRRVQYVHTLQNLYFALKDEELSLTQSDNGTNED